MAFNMFFRSRFRIKIIIIIITESVNFTREKLLNTIYIYDTLYACENSKTFETLIFLIYYTRNKQATYKLKKPQKEISFKNYAHNIIINKNNF